MDIGLHALLRILPASRLPSLFLVFLPAVPDLSLHTRITTKKESCRCISSQEYPGTFLSFPPSFSHSLFSFLSSTILRLAITLPNYFPLFRFLPSFRDDAASWFTAASRVTTIDELSERQRPCRSIVNMYSY